MTTLRQRLVALFQARPAVWLRPDQAREGIGGADVPPRLVRNMLCLLTKGAKPLLAKHTLRDSDGHRVWYALAAQPPDGTVPSAQPVPPPPPARSRPVPAPFPRRARLSRLHNASAAPPAGCGASTAPPAGSVAAEDEPTVPVELAGRTYYVPLRAFTSILGDAALPEELVRDCCVDFAMQAAATARSYRQISGPRGQLSLSRGEAWQRAMELPNPRRPGQKLRVAWDELLERARGAVRGAVLKIGVPPPLAEALIFSGFSLIEPYIAERLKREASASRVPASANQAGHLDGLSLIIQAVFSLTVGRRVSSTLVYHGPYTSLDEAHALCRAAAQRFGKAQANASAAAEGEEPKEYVAPLLLDRAELEARMRPIATLGAGEGALFLGPVIHAGAGNAEDEHRIVLFLTATFPGVQPYDVDMQILPWQAATNYFESEHRACELAIQYREYEPWLNYEARTAPRAALKKACDASAAAAAKLGAALRPKTKKRKRAA